MFLKGASFSAFKNSSYFNYATSPYKTFTLLSTLASISLTSKIFSHAWDAVWKAPKCFSAHVIGQTVLEGTTDLFHKIRSGNWGSLLPKSIRYQLFSMPEDTKINIQAALCQTNSPEIAEDYLTQALKNHSQGVQDLLCDQLSLKECTQSFLQNCPSKTETVINTVTDTLCADANYDLSMIEHYSRLLGALLCITAGAYVLKTLWNKSNHVPTHHESTQKVNPTILDELLVNPYARRFLTTSFKENSHVIHST